MNFALKLDYKLTDTVSLQCFVDLLKQIGSGAQCI